MSLRDDRSARPAGRTLPTRRMRRGRAQRPRPQSWYVWVEGYRRADGVRVPGHYRRSGSMARDVHS